MTDGIIDHIIVTPQDPYIDLGGSQKYTAQAYDAGRNPIAAVYTWSCNDPAAGSIDASTGVFTAGFAKGRYQDVVHAESAGKAGTASVTVNPSLFVGLVGKVWLLAYFILFFPLLAYLVYALWPTTSVGADGKTIDNPSVVFGHAFAPNDARMLLLVMSLGAIGSFIHAATSFIDFSGNKKLEKSWTWWYVLRPFIGAFLALVLFFAIKASLLALGVNVETTINTFTIAVVSALAGMFSKQATNKLSETFDTIFKSKKEEELAGKLTGSANSNTGK